LRVLTPAPRKRSRISTTPRSSSVCRVERRWRFGGSSGSDRDVSRIRFRGEGICSESRLPCVGAATVQGTSPKNTSRIVPRRLDPIRSSLRAIFRARWPAAGRTRSCADSGLLSA